MTLLFAFLISNISGVVYDFLYKMTFPYYRHRHKPYLDRIGAVLIQLMLNTLVSFVISLRILRGINFYRIKSLIRALIQIGIMILFYEYLNN